MISCYYIERVSHFKIGITYNKQKKCFPFFFLRAQKANERKEQHRQEKEAKLNKELEKLEEEKWSKGAKDLSKKAEIQKKKVPFSDLITFFFFLKFNLINALNSPNSPALLSQEEVVQKKAERFVTLKKKTSESRLTELISPPFSFFFTIFKREASTGRN